MSHATVVVFAGSLTQAEQLLAPYSEQEQVEEYPHRCSCVGREAKDRADAMVSEKRGKTWEEEGVAFDLIHPKVKVDKDDVEAALVWKTMSDRQNLWTSEVYGPRNREKMEILATLPDKDSPNPNCEDCKGTGFYPSTYNPLSKHDYFVDEMSDRGPWDWELALKPEDECKDANGEEKKSVPFAILTPMHGWEEKACLGWWGMTSEDKEEAVWHKMYFDHVAEALAVPLKPFRFDYHI